MPEQYHLAHACQHAVALEEGTAQQHVRQVLLGRGASVCSTISKPRLQYGVYGQQACNLPMHAAWAKHDNVCAVDGQHKADICHVTCAGYGGH